MSDMTPNRQAAEELTEIRREFEQLLARAQGALEGVPALMRRRAERSWFASVRTALDNDHDYLARGYTLQDTIDELTEGADG